MVQILNKMVHLKYPILEIWCCHKHITQLPPRPSRLKFDTKLRKVFSNNLAPQLCTSHSRKENIAPNFICSFQLIKCKQVILRFLAIVATFGTCYSSQMPLLQGSNVHVAKFKAEEYIPISTALHKSLLQAKYVEYCM